MRKSAVPHGFRILASQNYCGWKSYEFGPGFGMQQGVVLGSSSAWVLGYNNVFGIQQFFCLFFGIEQCLFYGIQQSVPVFLDTAVSIFWDTSLYFWDPALCMCPHRVRSEQLLCPLIPVWDKPPGPAFRGRIPSARSVLVVGAESD